MTTPVVELRAAQPDDSEWISELEELSLPNPWSADAVRETLREPAVSSWIAECGETAVGFLVGRFAGDEGEILRLAVDPAWRRGGIGGELVARFLLQARNRGTRSVFLEVRAENLPARRLYERLGFELMGLRAGYCFDGADASVYRRDLRQPLG